MNNANEDTAGTDPLDRTSRFAITQVSPAAGQVSLSFPTVAGRYYHIQSTTTLGTWAAEDEPTATNRLATGSSMTFIDINPGSQRKFYQAAVTRSPIP